VARRILVTGGAGFIGSHVAEQYALDGWQVRVLDNLSRAKLLKKPDRNASFNWDHLSRLPGVELIKGSVTDWDTVRQAAADCQVIVHAAAQTAVTTSVTDPRPDFENNIVGTFNVLEAAREQKVKPALVFCSTNKVYGENVNGVGLTEGEKRWSFEPSMARGIPETFPIDHCEHTPYGVSKLTGDLYMQDYAHLYGLKIGVFRMSCIYGTRQFGLEDQGWVAWFTIAALLGKPITIFGDGKQVRDVLYVEDLVGAYRAFLDSTHNHAVYNMGGGPDFTMSLHELLDILKEKTGITPALSYADWRPSDQKVYISNIDKAKAALGWKPSVTPSEGVAKLIDWVKANKDLFA
jgi:CDP-paratose 2-epimerase